MAGVKRRSIGGRPGRNYLLYLCTAASSDTTRVPRVHQATASWMSAEFSCARMVRRALSQSIKYSRLFEDTESLFGNRRQLHPRLCTQ